MKKVLFVCLGNICRSPIAEGVFRRMVDELELDMDIDSAGTASYHIGELPDKRARLVCEERGIKLTHKARALTKDDFTRFDYILAMDRQNLVQIQKMQTPGTTAKMMLMRDFDTQGKGGEVPDPYYGELDGFVEVFEMVERCCEQLVDVIRQ